MRRLCIGVVGALLVPALAAAGEGRLLVPLAPAAGQAAEQPASLPPPHSVGVLRARTVGVDLAALPGADGRSALPPAGHTIRLDLFDDVSLTARMVRAERIEKGMSWVGRLDGQPMSTVVLVVYDGILSGSITWPDDAYRIRFDGIHSVVEQLDESQFPEDHCFKEVPAGATATTTVTSAETVASADDGSLVDVLVVYTPAARAAAGGTSAMLSLVNLGVTETNAGYANSGVLQRIRLVGAAEVSYTESGTTSNDMATDLDRITNPSDGYIDNVHALRNAYGADVVSFWETGYNNVNGACGIAWLMGGNDPTFAPNAFSVVDISCATGYYSFGHEMGHNMGLNHARQDPTGVGAFSYSYGYKWTGYRTVLAYAPGTRIDYFSNPNVSYLGNPTGVVETSPSSAYNALSLNNTRVTVANWRQAISLAVVTPNGGESWAAGSVHTISWTTANLDASATISLAYTDGTSSYPIVTGLVRTVTSYNWTVPNTPGSNWKVTVCGVVGGVCGAQDSSDASFSITPPPPVVAVVAPNGGESWPAGSIQVISWTAANLNPGATITLTYTNGTTTKPIAAAVSPTTTSYSWTIPNDQASNWKVIVCSDVAGSCEAQDSSDASFSITPPASPPGRHDFNVDGSPDLIWHHQTSGALYAWFMRGTTESSGGSLSPNTVNPVWQVRGVGDLNRDGSNDILWQNQSTGALYLWMMNGTVESSGTFLNPSTVNPVWRIEGLADFDGDGELDILWRNTSSGQVYVWFMNGLSLSTGTFLNPSTVAMAWQIRGIADFNGDGKPDILWYNTSTGQVYVWFMNGVNLSSGSFLNPSVVADKSWQIEQVDDFNGDGKPDILWRNTSSGQVYVWFMNGTVFTAGTLLNPSQVSDTRWKIVSR